MRNPTIVLASLIGLLSACDKDKEVLPDPTPDPHPNTVVSMSMAYVRSGAAFDASVPFTDAAGTLIRLDKLKFFLAQPFFVNDEGDTVARFPNKYLLIDQSEGGAIRTIGQLDGHLHILHCGLGVDSAMNHADPLTMPAPLNDPEMWWGWASGHLFLVMEGKYDSDANSTIDDADLSFSYHAGMDTLYRPYEVMVHTDADEGGDVVIPLSLNVDSLMKGMDVASQPLSMEVSPLTVGLMKRLSNSITHAE